MLLLLKKNILSSSRKKRIVFFEEEDPFLLQEKPIVEESKILMIVSPLITGAELFGSDALLVLPSKDDVNSLMIQTRKITHNLAIGNEMHLWMMSIQSRLMKL